MQFQPTIAICISFIEKPNLSWVFGRYLHCWEEFKIACASTWCDYIFLTKPIKAITMPASAITPPKISITVQKLM